MNGRDGRGRQRRGGTKATSDHVTEPHVEFRVSFLSSVMAAQWRAERLTRRLCRAIVALQRWMRIKRDGGRTQEFGECVRRGDVLQGDGEREARREPGRVDEHESVRER